MKNIPIGTLIRQGEWSAVAVSIDEAHSAGYEYLSNADCLFRVVTDVFGEKVKTLSYYTIHDSDLRNFAVSVPLENLEEASPSKVKPVFDYAKEMGL